MIAFSWRVFYGIAATAAACSGRMGLDLAAPSYLFTVLLDRGPSHGE